MYTQEKNEFIARWQGWDITWKDEDDGHSFGYHHELHKRNKCIYPSEIPNYTNDRDWLIKTAKSLEVADFDILLSASNEMILNFILHVISI